MIYRLINFAHAVLKLLMFKVGGIISISKMQFLNFSGSERVKQFSLTTQNNDDYLL